MIRKAIRMMLVPLVAVFALSSVAEAAPRKAVRHRPKHSSRVSTGAVPPESQGEPGATKTSGSRAATAAKSGSTAKKSTGKQSTTKQSTTKHSTTKHSTSKRPPTTKPQ
jgi:hypothetical protein